MAVLNLCAEMHEWDFRRVMREMDYRDMVEVWQPYFRLVRKEQEKETLPDEATAARQRALQRTERGVP
jgi:hypothetical protein